MLLHDDGLPGSRLSPVWREGPHGGQRRAPHRPGKAPGAPGCGRVARRAPCHGLGRTRQTSALHGTPHHRRHCTPLEKKRKSRGQGRCAWEGRAVAARGSMASRHGAARHDAVARGVGGDLGCLVREERMAPGGATRNGPWCGREGSTQRCQRRSRCIVPWTWRSGSQRPRRRWRTWKGDDCEQRHPVALSYLLPNSVAQSIIPVPRSALPSARCLSPML
jgi:hypothetical protein